MSGRRISAHYPKFLGAVRTYEQPFFSLETERKLATSKTLAHKPRRLLWGAYAA